MRNLSLILLFKLRIFMEFQNKIRKNY